MILNFVNIFNNILHIVCKLSELSWCKTYAFFSWAKATILEPILSELHHDDFFFVPNSYTDFFLIIAAVKYFRIAMFIISLNSGWVVLFWSSWVSCVFPWWVIMSWRRQWIAICCERPWAFLRVYWVVDQICWDYLRLFGFWLKIICLCGWIPDTFLFLSCLEGI